VDTCSELHIDLRQMVIAIETAVSLVGMNDTNHGKRVGYIASQIGNQLGFDEQDLQFTFDLGLLHDCGVSTQQMHSQLVNHFDWQDAHIHCEIGHRLLENFDPLSSFAVPILHHHTPWNELKNLAISPQDARMANLTFLSDRVDVLAASHYDTDILLFKTEILNSITSYEGTYFDPLIVEAFHHVEKCEAFWIALKDSYITRYVWDMGQFKTNKTLNIHQLKQLSLIMGYIVDQKSPFTARHSTGVANLARYIASTIGLTREQCEKIEIAGLLHDLGKLHTPDDILEKPGPLNDIERAIMNRHSYETYEILRHITGLNEIACWAAYHHEGLNGAGYPFHPTEMELSIEARIIAVADIFQALVQDRPYREGMPLSQVIEILDEFTSSGKLDPNIVDHVKKHSCQCFEIAQVKIGDDCQSFHNLFPADNLTSRC